MENELDEILKYLVDNVEMIRIRVELRHLKPADGFIHNERLKSEAKQAILTHRNTELEKLLEQKIYDTNLKYVVPASAIQDLMKKGE